SVGAQHEKALKQAFYNTVALVFVSLVGAAAVAVYFVMEPFLRPLLWAGLCGAFLHPFKRTLTRIFRGWLKSMSSSNTPLVVGAAVLPFQLLNNCSDVLGGFIARRFRLIVMAILLLPIVYGLYVFQPFLEILRFVQNIGLLMYNVMEYFTNPFMVWSIVIGYTGALIFWWSSSTSKVLHILSVPVWLAFLIHIASIAGPYRVPLFLLVAVLSIVGLIAEETNNDNPQTKRHSIFQGLTVAAAALASPLEVDSDDSTCTNEDSPKATQHTSETPFPATPKDITDGKAYSRLQRLRQLKQTRVKIKKSSKSKRSSRPYLIAVLWGIVITRLWIHAWILQLLPIPIAIYLIKLVVVWSGAWACMCEWAEGLIDRLKTWVLVRKDALVPPPLRGLAKMIITGDQKVNLLMEMSIDNLMSVFIVLCLIVVSIVVTVLLAVQVHHESVYLVTVTGNLVNDIVKNNPQLVEWITENAELKKTFDANLERAYMYGRKWIASKVEKFLGGQSGNSTQLQQTVLELTDRLYHAWIGGKNDTLNHKSVNGSRVPMVHSKANMTSSMSWLGMMNWFRREGINFDFTALFSVVRENLGILMSLLESVWMIVKGNVSMVINLVTMVLSLVFFSGTYVLNAGLSMVVFMTALFYLLSTSGDQYRPVEWFGQMSASGTAGFGESLYKAIRDVFGAALKMATFYGLYTVLTHTIFGVNIVFIPSAIAAVTSVVPFVGTYWAAVPAVLELWLVHEDSVRAIILAVCHVLPTYVVDTAIYSEISGGGHPYLTGLAVAGGIYCVGLEGAIIGPIVLCCLIVACNVYGSMIQ
ncbi:predicted protein, partial [Nematostella vectensis]